jgi:hypothetical protein
MNFFQFVSPNNSLTKWKKQVKKENANPNKSKNSNWLQAIIDFATSNFLKQKTNII